MNNLKEVKDLERRENIYLFLIGLTMVLIAVSLFMVLPSSAEVLDIKEFNIISYYIAYFSESYKILIFIILQILNIAFIILWLKTYSQLMKKSSSAEYNDNILKKGLSLLLGSNILLIIAVVLTNNCIIKYTATTPELKNIVVNQVDSNIYSVKSSDTEKFYITENGLKSANENNNKFYYHDMLKFNYEEEISITDVISNIEQNSNS